MGYWPLIDNGSVVLELLFPVDMIPGDNYVWSFWQIYVPSFFPLVPFLWLFDVASSKTYDVKCLVKKTKQYIVEKNSSVNIFRLDKMNSWILVSMQT